MLEQLMVLMTASGSAIMSKQCWTFSGQVLDLTMDRALLFESSFSGWVVPSDALPGVSARCTEVLKRRKRQLLKISLDSCQGNKRKTAKGLAI